MCQLCSGDEDERIQERNRLRSEAERLRQLASMYESLASGQIKPHMEMSSTMALRAKAMIRSLVEDWL